MTARAIFPVTRIITCQCCGDDLDADDFHPELFRLNHADAVEATHNGPVCFNCMDAHKTCCVTGDLILPGQGYRGEDGDLYLSERVYDEAIEAQAEEDAHHRTCARWRL